MKHLQFGILAFILLFGSVSRSSAHPHVWIDVSSEMVSKPGEPLALRMIWKMDQFLSSALLEDFDHDRDGQLSDAEIADMRNTAFKALEGGSYFTVVVADGQDFLPVTAGDFTAVAENSVVTYHFKLTFDGLSPAQTRKWDLFVYDPENYVDFQFIGDSPMRAAGCLSEIVDAPERTYYSGLLFARKAAVSCTGS